MATKSRGGKARELPPVGTALSAKHKGKSYSATIVEAKDRPAGRAVQYGEQVFTSLSAAGKAITGHATNGWKFWQPVEQDQE
jgi:hypothetical protein